MASASSPLRAVLVAVLVLVSGLAGASASSDDLYCGAENCYDVLGVQRAATTAEVRRAYRRLSLELHPDKNPSAEAKERFLAVSTAHDVLSDDALRAEYDYYLDHPSEALYNRMRFYQFRYSRSDWRLVILGAVALLSVLTFVSQRHKYHLYLDHLRESPDFLARAEDEAWAAVEAAREAAKGGESGSPGPAAASGARRRKGKKEVEAELTPAEEALFVEVQSAALERIVREVRIVGSHHAPSVTDLFAVQLVLLPWRLGRGLWWYAQWYVRHSLRGEPYDAEERVYLTRRQLQLDEDAWELTKPEEREDVLKRELWVPANWEAFLKERRREALASLSTSDRRKVLNYLREKERGGR